MISEINSNASTISETLAEKAESVGYTLSDTLTSTWNTSANDTKNVLTTYGENIQNGILSASTTLNDSLNAINTNLFTVVSLLCI